jgi:hypothetical protein
MTIKKYMLLVFVSSQIINVTPGTGAGILGGFLGGAVLGTVISNSNKEKHYHNKYTYRDQLENENYRLQEENYRLRQKRNND